MHIAYKEANETKYWFSAMQRSNLITEKEYSSIDGDLSEIFALLTTIIKTSKQKLKES